MERILLVSVGQDHLWGSLRASVAPGDLGVANWAAWDLDANGALDMRERAGLSGRLREHVAHSVSASVDGRLLAFSRSKLLWTEEGEGGGPGIDQLLSFRLEARTPLTNRPGEHVFVLYDRPSQDRVVPIRFSLAGGMQLVTAHGARWEQRTSRRLEAVVTRVTPGLWGTFVRNKRSP